MRASRYKTCLAIASGTAIVLLIACGINNPQTPAAPSREATRTPSQPATKTPIQTATTEPTFSYWATAQEATFEVERTQVAATKEAIFDLATHSPQLCGYDIEGVSISPNGEWIASDCKLSLEVFRVFQTHGNQVWDVPYATVMKYYPEFIGNVRALHWSADGNNVYFTSSSCCADTDATTNGDALYRLDLQTGNWTAIAQGPFSYYSFSPDGQRLIYLVNNQANANSFLHLHVHVLDLKSKKEEIIDVAGFEQSWIVWKDDGQKMALLARTGNIYDDNMRFSLVVVDLISKKQYPVILNTEDSLGVMAWSDDDILTISRSNIVEYNDYYVNVFDVMIYDLKVDLFVTPTP